MVLWHRLLCSLEIWRCLAWMEKEGTLHGKDSNIPPVARFPYLSPNVLFPEYQLNGTEILSREIPCLLSLRKEVALWQSLRHEDVCATGVAF